MQETHIKEKDKFVLENQKLGELFAAGNERQKKKGVAIHVKEKGMAKEIFRDKEGFFIGTEIKLQAEKILLVNLYAPQENKGEFYKKLCQLIIRWDYEKIIIAGDWNGVWDPEIDRSNAKKGKGKQGKLPNSAFELMEELNLIDMWRTRNNSGRDYTFYSDRFKTWSRIESPSLEVFKQRLNGHLPGVL